MQSWAKRGLQTALVTGGLLMLGTGIASADNLNPDKPASPLDLNVTVPVDVADNAVGTPLGQIDLPGGHTEVSTKLVTKPLKELAAQLDHNPINGAVGENSDGLGTKFTPTNRVLKGNKVTGDVVVPLQAVGNAVAAGGNASVNSTGHEQNWSHDQDVVTNGDRDSIAGNVVNLDWALPVQLAGNAVGAAGTAASTGDAAQSASETGNTITSGNKGTLNGNAITPQVATPIQVTGNAVSGLLGSADSDFTGATAATAGGYTTTSGKNGTLNGNVGAVPVALPVKLVGSSVSGLAGNSVAAADTSADATAGGTTPGWAGIDSFVQTAGDRSALGGNIIAPQGGALASVAGDAASALVGNSVAGGALADYAATGSSSSNVQSGGFTSTSGSESAASGNIASAAPALPVEVFGTGASFIGNSHAQHDNTSSTVVGEGSHTVANNAFLAANAVTAQPAAAPDVFGSGVGAIGQAAGTATTDKTVKSGNFDGTAGNNSAGAGNLVQVPAAVPAEVFGLGAGGIGQGTGVAAEHKVVQGGGGGSTNDPNSALDSNLVTAPVSLPAQVFGDGVGGIGRGIGQANSDTTSVAGGDLAAEGVKSAGSGNIAHVPVSLPTQAHGLAPAVLGLASGASDNLTDSKAGGKAVTTGEDGGLAGNVVGVPAGGTADAFGTGAALGALATGQSINDVSSAAGGTTATNGNGGGLSGDVVTAQALPIVDAFGAGAGVAGKALGVSTSNTDAASGGGITTSGHRGGFSGDIVDVPVAAVPQVFGDAAGALGKGNGAAENMTHGVVGGKNTTEGHGGVSGINGQLPIGLVPQVYRVPVEVIGQAKAVATNDTTIERAPQFNLPVDGSELGAASLPTLGGATQRADLPVTGGNPLSSLGSVQNLAAPLSNLGG
jgi:hypothetical protein